MMKNKELFEKFKPVFLEQNSRLNLISKNDEKLLWEKHFFDSLAAEKVFEKYGTPADLLDIGAGGGFPSVPLAMKFPEIEVFALDSIGKKIRAIDEIKEKLEILNLHTICARVENLGEMFAGASARALAPLEKLYPLVLPHLKRGGIFIAYKSKKVEDEIRAGNSVLKRAGGKIIDIIEYTLPTTENHERSLVVIKKL